MGILVYRDQTSASAAAATLIAAQIIEKPDSVLGLLGGNMLEGTYARLCGMTGSGLLDWSDIHAFHLSEFVGLRSDQNRSLGGFLSHYLYEKVNIHKSNIHVPDNCASDLSAACTAFEEQLLSTGGMDMALLYVGRNGHVAFNEPAAEFAPLTHVAPLTQSSLEENLSYFSDRPNTTPRVLTMGISTLLSARKLVVLALGSGVSNVAAQMINGPITPCVPASVLQLHQNVIYVLDEAAAVRL